MLYNIIWRGEGRRGTGGLIIIFKAREIREREGKEERENGILDYVTARNLYSICLHVLTMFIKVPIYRSSNDEGYGGSNSLTSLVMKGSGDKSQGWYIRRKLMLIYNGIIVLCLFKRLWFK